MFETTLKKNVRQLKNLKFIPRQIIFPEVMNKFLKYKNPHMLELDLCY